MPHRAGVHRLGRGWNQNHNFPSCSTVICARGPGVLAYCSVLPEMAVYTRKSDGCFIGWALGPFLFVLLFDECEARK